ncbi:cyclin-dependent kinase 5 activator 1-like [Engraulis encrasicolus]|uniref:cyclin-dependent kinase 5 activator 1-like n=1 Tax=Engraulis encrasicolus TaxID=184585 RepID=UPI002FD78936
MGTVLSISPTSRKAKGGILTDEKPDATGSGGGVGVGGGASSGGKSESSKGGLKRHSVLISALTWKRLVAASAKKKNAKKVNPNPNPAPQANTITNPAVDQLNSENLKKSLQQTERKATKQGPLAVPVPTVPDQHSRRGIVGPQNQQSGQNQQQNPKQLIAVQKQPSSRSLISPRRVIVQASTGELLRCLSEFMCRRCYKLKELSPNEIILWFRNVDRSLLIQGWQDQGFITPANLVFVYMLCREAVTEDISTEYELQATFLTCLYLAYSYMGNEISYPLKPFLVESNKEVFWERSLRVIDKMSAKMLQINSDPHFFTEVFQDLKNEGGPRDSNSNVKWTNNLDR